MPNPDSSTPQDVGPIPASSMGQSVKSPVNWPLVLAILVQFSGLFIWGGQASARITALESRVAALGEVNARLAGIEAKLDDVKGELERLEMLENGFGSRRYGAPSPAPRPKP